MRALTLVAVLVGALTFWSNVFPQTSGLIDRHRRDARLTRAQAMALPGEAWGAREDVLAWADQLLPHHSRVFLDCPQPASCSNGLANWITYRLAPRVFTDFPEQAQWILFYHATGAVPPLPRLTGWHRYSPGFAIARVGT